MPPVVRLVTTPLTMEVSSVTSKAASDATDDQWSSTLGLSQDEQPEVPPDGASQGCCQHMMHHAAWGQHVAALLDDS
jgi:hypothetical protein